MKSKAVVAAVLVGALLSCGAGKWKDPQGTERPCKEDPNCRSGGGCEPACADDECAAEDDNTSTPRGVTIASEDQNVGGAAGAADEGEPIAPDSFGGDEAQVDSDEP